MADIIFGLELNEILVALGIFISSFIILLVLWSAVLRGIFSALGRTKYFFIPRTLKELFFSIAFAFLMVSALLSLMSLQTLPLGGELFKIIEILLIFAIANVIARLVLTGLDVQHKKAKDRSGIYRSIGLLKGTVGIMLYVIAFIIAISVLSAELGVVVLIMGLSLVILLFVAGFDHIKSIIAGMQLGDYYVDVGRLMKVGGHTGFVESVTGRSTIIKSLDGRTLVIPNQDFFRMIFEINHEERSEMRVKAAIEGKSSRKIKERLSAISSRICIELSDIPNEYKPRVFYVGIEQKKHIFDIFFRITPESDVHKIIDRFCTEVSEEFRDSVSGLALAS